MKRRHFLKVSAGAAGVVGTSLVYPAVTDVVDIPVPEVLEKIGAHEIVDMGAVPVQVRLMNGNLPMTEWFRIRNDTPELVIEKMEECVLTHLECIADLDVCEIPFELPIDNAKVYDEGDGDG